MKTIIAGCRTCTDMKILEAAIAKIDWKISTVVCGKARGTDHLGETWAKTQGIPIMGFPADWNMYGRSAGYRRNAVMAEHADALVALWDGKSRGTKSMIDLATKANLKIYVHLY